MSFLQETANESQPQAFSTNTSPNDMSNQQSRRGSIFELQQSRVSNQNFVGNSPKESSDKYLQDSFETEKLKSNQTSSNNKFQSSGSSQKGSLRYYDGLQSIGDADKERDETSPAMQQDPSMYKNNEFKYNQILQDYEQRNQTQAETQDQFYTTQLDYADQPQNLYESEQYSRPQYDQQNYAGIEYSGAEVSQPTDEYDYQSEYQEYSTQQPNYQTNNLQLEPLRQEQYGIDAYEEKATKPILDSRSAQHHSNFTEPSISNPNMGNTTRQPTMPIQSTTKKPA